MSTYKDYTDIHGENPQVIEMKANNFPISQDEIENIFDIQYKQAD